MNQSALFLSLGNVKSSFVVALVALPLCLGVALASGAPLESGLISGIIGGLVVGCFSGSEVSVSGPAAGLTVLVASAILKLGAFEKVCGAVLVAGLIQILFSWMRLGWFSYFIPAPVIEGMLFAIGMIIILKQIPHLLGDDYDYLGDFSFLQIDGQNALSEIRVALEGLDLRTVIISLVSIAVYFLWTNLQKRKWRIAEIVPTALLAVLAGTFSNLLLLPLLGFKMLEPQHLVALPSFHLGVIDFHLRWLLEFSFWKITLTFALVASIESILSLEATDKIDSKHRISNKNRELFAQGLGNSLSGLLGGLPVTSVIVRSSANVQSGATGRLSTILHGVWLALGFVFFSQQLNKIPIATLSVVLVFVGIKLTAIERFAYYRKRGWSQLIPFATTIVAILFTDLLTGIFIGLSVSLVGILKRSFRSSILFVENGDEVLIRFNRDVSFLNKARFASVLKKAIQYKKVTVDGSRSVVIDEDIIDQLDEFQRLAHTKGVEVNIVSSPLALHPKFRGNV